MKHSSLSLQFITPAYLGCAWPKREGADGPHAQLRIPSILGQLRWWHRTLGRQDSEDRIFGSVAGESGRAAGFSLRIRNAPDPVKSATSPASLGLERSYFLYAQEMDNGANLRAAIPAGSTFTLILINRRLPDKEWTLLLDTAKTFSALGTLGNRSRRGFGAIRLLEHDGRGCNVPEPATLLPAHLACAFPDGCQPAANSSSFLINAGNWLREARATLKESGK